MLVFCLLLFVCLFVCFVSLGGGEEGVGGGGGGGRVLPQVSSH